MEQALLVTTDKGGVFFGYGEPPATPECILLRRARMCVSWSMEMHGFLGLGSVGPDKDCCVSPAVPEFTLWGLTSVTIVSPEAAKAWERAPWKK